MKILLCHNLYQQPGGEDQVFEAESQLLESHGHTVIRYQLHNDAIVGIGAANLALKTLWNRQSYRELRDLIRRERPAIMHCTNVFPLISPAAYYAALSERVPVVQSLHNYRLLCANALFHRDGKVCEECLGKLIPWNGIWHGCYRKSHTQTAGVTTMVLAHRLMRTWSKAVHRYITPTEFARSKFVQAGFSADLIVAKPNFLADDPGMGTGDGGYAIFVGRLSTEKGLDCLLEAWKRLPDQVPLKIVGDGPQADLVRQAIAVDPRIEWLGRRPLAEVAQLIGKASFLVTSSTCYETFGRTIIEAYAAGTPVICSNMGAMAELLLEGQTGYAFQPGNADDLAKTVSRIDRDETKRQQMRFAARNEFVTKYTAAINYTQLTRVYRDVMKASGTACVAKDPFAEDHVTKKSSPKHDSPATLLDVPFASLAEPTHITSSRDETTVRIRFSETETTISERTELAATPAPEHSLSLLYAASMYPPSIGGAQLHLHCLAKEMQRKGHAVRVITQSSRNRQDWLRFTTFQCEQREDFEYDGIPVHRLGYSNWDRLRMLPWAAIYYAMMPPAVQRLGKIIEKYIPEFLPPLDLIHCSRIGREFIAQAALNLARQRNIPFVLTPNHHARWKSWLYREYDRIYRESDAVIALTEVEREMLIREKGVSPDRVFVTGIGPVLSQKFDAQKFRDQFKIHDRFVLWVGQQHEYKGLGAVTEAAKLVWRRDPNMHFVFIGPDTDYSRKVFANLTDPRLHNLGKVDLETKTSALEACELLCLPSRQESFGGVLVEAWSHRKPVIGGRIPQIAAVIDEGRDGLLSSQDPAELADAMLALLHDSAGAREMGQLGWEKVHRLYTHERLAQRTLEIYRAAGVSIPTAHDEQLIPSLTERD